MKPTVLRTGDTRRDLPSLVRVEQRQKQKRQAGYALVIPLRCNLNLAQDKIGELVCPIKYHISA